MTEEDPSAQLFREDRKKQNNAKQLLGTCLWPPEFPAGLAPLGILGSSNALLEDHGADHTRVLLLQKLGDLAGGLELGLKQAMVELLHRPLVEERPPDGSYANTHEKNKHPHPTILPQHLHNTTNKSGGTAAGQGFCQPHRRRLPKQERAPQALEASDSQGSCHLPKPVVGV